MSQAQQRWPKRSDPGSGGQVGANHAARTRLSGSDAESDGLSLKSTWGGRGPDCPTTEARGASTRNEVRSATQLSDSEGGRNTNPRHTGNHDTERTAKSGQWTRPRLMHRRLWTTARAEPQTTPPSGHPKRTGMGSRPYPTGSPHGGGGARARACGGLGLGRAGASACGERAARRRRVVGRGSRCCGLASGRRVAGGGAEGGGLGGVSPLAGRREPHRERARIARGLRRLPPSVERGAGASGSASIGTRLGGLGLVRVSRGARCRVLGTSKARRRPLWGFWRAFGASRSSAALVGGACLRRGLAGLRCGGDAVRLDH